MNPDIFELVKWVVMAGVVYGGIRQDLKNIHEKVSDLKHDTQEAHSRLDRHIEVYHRREGD